MRRTLLCLAAISLVSCSDQTQLSGQPPAAQLSLAELAAGNVQTTFVTVEPVERPPSTIYRRIVESLQTGELDIMEADRLVMPLLFGERGDVPDQFRESEAASGVPDIALFWIMQRLPSYPGEVQEEIRSWLPGVRGGRVAGAAPRFSLLAPSVVYASSQESSPADGTCVAQENIFGGTFLNLGEHVVGGGIGGGIPLRLVMCGRSPADQEIANHVATMAREAISDISAFFGKDFIPTSGRPEFQIFLEHGSVMTNVATGESANRGGMLSCHEIGVNQLVDQCELRATVIHEVFHCLNMQAQGYDTDEQKGADLTPGYFYGRQPDWLSEGSAVWAEDRFAPDNNSEWGFHQTMAEFPFHALEVREYTAGIFFNFLEQHTGGDDAVFRALEEFTDKSGVGAFGGKKASTLEDLFPWPSTWFDFSEALSGFKPLYEQGRPKLTDQPTFPYEESAGCMGETKYVTQEKHGRRLPLGPYESRFYDLQIPALSVTYEIVEFHGAGPSAQYLDVGFGGDVVDRIQSEKIGVTAILRMDSGDSIVDWSDLWLAEGVGAEPILMPPGMGEFSPKETKGRFRMCLTDEVEGCDDLPEQKIYRGLYEIDIIMANAGTSETDDIGVDPDESFLALVTGAMPGWKAIRVETEPGFPEGQEGL